MGRFAPLLQDFGDLGGGDGAAVEGPDDEVVGFATEDCLSIKEKWKDIRGIMRYRKTSYLERAKPVYLNVAEVEVEYKVSPHKVKLDGMDLAAYRSRVESVLMGLYDQPKPHPLLGQVGAGTDAIVAAIARKRNLRLLPSPALAANQLGLSTQVPARIVYHTDGAPTHLSLGNLQIDFRRNTGRLLSLAGRSSGLVAQALRDVGKDHVTDDHLNRIRAHLPASARKQLLQDLAQVPAWMRSHFRQIARNDD